MPRPDTAPIVSVVIPALNAARTLEATLAALSRLVPGTPPFEIIVVDNGSTDATRAIADAAGARVEGCAVRGPAAARNTGVAVARGRIVAFTDADCVPDGSWILKGARVLDAEPQVAVVAGDIVGTAPRTPIQAWMNQRRILDPRPPVRHPFRPFAQTANAFFRTDDVRRVDGFDIGLRAGEDCDLSWRVLDATGGRLAFEPGALVAHDHRTDLRGLLRQSAHNATADARLAIKWGPAYGTKAPGRSLWEIREVARLAARAAGTFARRDGRHMDALCDLALAAGRKWGMIRAAAATGAWSRW